VILESCNRSDRIFVLGKRTYLAYALGPACIANVTASSVSAMLSPSTVTTLLLCASTLGLHFLWCRY
jgi:hypothetical protein